MNKILKKIDLAQKRCWRVRRKVFGTAERPRLSVCFSNKNIYAQCIDDTAGKTLAAACTTSKELKSEKILPNMAGAQKLGELFGDKLSAAGIKAVVYDKGARRYHGCVKAFADAVRSKGINF